MAEATANEVNESLTKSQRALQAEAAAVPTAAVPTAAVPAAPKKPVIERGTVTKVKRVQLPPPEPQAQEEVEEVEEVEVKPVKIKKTAKKAETGEIKKEIKKVRGPKKLAQPTTLEGFYRAKDKRPTSFNFSQAGHAVAPEYIDKDDKVFPERTFQLPQYRPITK